MDNLKKICDLWPSYFQSKNGRVLPLTKLKLISMKYLDEIFNQIKESFGEGIAKSFRGKKLFWRQINRPTQR